MSPNPLAPPRGARDGCEHIAVIGVEPGLDVGAIAAQLAAVTDGVHAAWSGPIDESAWSRRRRALTSESGPLWMSCAQSTGAAADFVLRHADVVVWVTRGDGEVPGPETERPAEVVLWLSDGAAPRRDDAERPLLVVPVTAAGVLLDPAAVSRGLPLRTTMLDSVRALPVFRGLDDARIASLLRTFRWRRLRGGEVLCRAGEAGDRAWILVAGRLKVYVPTAEGEAYQNTLGPGTFLGTVALLRGGNRAATLVAARDVLLIEVSEQAFLDMFQREPEAARRVLAALTDELLTRTGPRTGDAVRVVTLVPLDASEDAVSAARALQAAWGPMGSSEVVTAADVTRTFGQRAVRAAASGPLDGRITEWLSRVEQQHGVVFLVADPDDTPWTRRCVRHADQVVAVVDAHAERHRRPVEDVIEASRAFEESATGLLLIHPPYATRGRDTAAWLTRRASAAVYHLRRSRTDDAGRVMRSLLRRGVGLALGGGGCRGLGHVGVMGAFADQGIPIDVVSGTSAGAAVAGLIGMGCDYEQVVDAIGRLLSSTRGHARNLGPPIVSLMSGQHVRRLLDEMFGTTQLEDLFVPTRIVSVDLRRAEPYVFERGPIWQAVRASASLPVVWPPVLIDDRVLVDGGLQDNLPARWLLPDARHGAIVASQVFPYRAGRIPLHYDQAILSGWKALRHVVRRDARLPNLVEVMMRAMVQGSKRSDEETIRRYVDLLLHPDIGRIGMFAVRTRKETVRIAEQARIDVRQKVADWDWRAVVRAGGEGR